MKPVVSSLSLSIGIVDKQWQLPILHFLKTVFVRKVREKWVKKLNLLVS